MGKVLESLENSVLWELLADIQNIRNGLPEGSPKDAFWLAVGGDLKTEINLRLYEDNENEANV